MLYYCTSAAQVSIGFENTAYSFAENDTAAQVCVKVTGDLQANVQVSYETANDTANNTATGEQYRHDLGHMHVLFLGQFSLYVDYI